MSNKQHPMYPQTAPEMPHRNFLRWLSRPPGPPLFTLAALLLLCALGVCGCSNSSSSSDGSLAALSRAQAAKIVQAVIDDSITHKPGNHSPLYPVEDVTQNPKPWKVHIDLSSNMQGYVNPDNSSLRLLLEHLHKFMPAGSLFQGERSDAPNPPNQLAQLVKPETYVGTGVNYSNLFMRLIAETDNNHLLLTDCVLLDNRRLLPPRCIADELKVYLARGGDFSLLVFRMPFRGDYTSAWRLTHLPGNAPAEDAVIRDLQHESRPILMWVFTPPGQSIGNQTGPIGKIVDLLNLKPTAPLNGESGFGKWQCLFPPSRGRQQFQFLANSLPSGYESNTISAQGFNGMPWAKFANLPEGVTFSFKASLPTTSPEGTNQNRAALLAAVSACTEANVDCWAITNLESCQIARLTRAPPEAAWTNLPGASTNQAWEACQLNVRLKRPALPNANMTPDRMVLMFTVLPNRSAATSLWKDLSSLSTTDDSSPSAADRIYGLEDVLGLVQTECAVYARTLLFAEWGR